MMCGRFSLAADLDFLIERFQIDYPITFDYQHRYNVAPSQKVIAVVRGEKGNKMGQLRWGFVPPWANDPSIGYKMINARAETVAEKASFKQSFKSRRCLILADGFYEWKNDEGRRQPHRIILKNEQPFAFAGLWSTWEKDGVKLATCTILTTAASPLMQNLHHRMPVILSQEEEELWLNPRTNQDTLEKLLDQYPDEAMEYFPVSDAVNSPKNESKQLLERVES